MRPSLPNAADVIALHDRLAVGAGWPMAEPSPLDDPLWQWIVRNHRFNSLLWAEEDLARRTTVADAEIAANKRAIDGFNQARNDAIEKVDDWLVTELAARAIQAAAGTPAATETPGSAIDRLSILELRRFHMREQLDRADATQEHREKAAARMAVLDAQRGHLIEAIDRLLTEIFLGQRPLRVFRMMKMYNDPTMNPYLYKAQSRSAA